ncbi:spore germination protein GerPB [Paenibacillus sp. N1-5-1-14]|uniref:spore germination protein GerPB n=1 Tax=Paenibacillus radicibacter TaxID=2972488 RepID=UPI00215948C9|nr:spore germination protein GerPB [Paenibacillus radicibacter]MCR8641202.1 spore germination protein GerPB [Paenibacillus radicibacter]
MNLTVHQSITIHQLRVDAVTNSSVLQIGASGMIKAMSNLYNTGGFTGPAKEFEQEEAAAESAPLVPLPPVRQSQV